MTETPTTIIGIDKIVRSRRDDGDFVFTATMRGTRNEQFEVEVGADAIASYAGMRKVLLQDYRAFLDIYDINKRGGERWEDVVTRTMEAGEK